MSEPSPPPVDESGAYERVLAAAQEVFAERGFKAATVREICQAAGANIAAINYYFGGKEQLYIEVVKRAHVCAGRMDDLPVAPDATPVERLRAFVTAMVTKMHAPVSSSAMKLMMREMSDPGKAAHVVVNEFIQPAAFALRSILRELLPHLDEHRLLMTGFSVMGQCLFYRQNIRIAELIFGKEPVAALDATAVAEHVVGFTLAALGHAPPVGVESQHVEKL